MRIKKNLLLCKTFIVFFSVLFNVIAPALASVNNTLKSGGQLLKAVQSDTQADTQRFVFHSKNEKQIDTLDISANTNVSVKEEKIIAPDKASTPEEEKKEVKVSEKKPETKEIAKPEPEKEKEVTAPEKKTAPVKAPAKEKEKKEVTVVQKNPTVTKTEKKEVKAAEEKEAAQAEDQGEEKIVFNFEDVDLSNVASYVEKLFDVTFITDEAISPMIKGGKGLSGNKISFKTQNPLTKKQAWNLFIAFLNMVGLTLVPQGQQEKGETKFYRIRIIASPTQTDAKRSPIPSYIGVDPETLPESDILIRYGYFVKDCPLDTIKTVIDSLKSSFADLLVLHDHNAFILTDSAYNIKVLMKIVKELDRVTMPQSMSVVQLYKVDAEQVKKVYDDLIRDDQAGTVAARIFGPRKPSKALYFPKNTKMIIEPRTNSLVLLGTADGIKKVEEFVKKYIDIDVTAPYSPLNIYELKYADAGDIANIMNNLVKFGSEKQRGGVRAGDKYFKNMTFTPEKEGNRLIIRGDFDDYLKVRDIIAELDEAPTQVAIEILLLGVDVQDKKELGAQIRNKFKIPAGQAFNFQTSGITLGGSAQNVVLNTDTAAKGNLRLLGDLVNLVTGATAGTTVLTLGSDRYGIWGIFGMLNQLTNTQILSNPFLTATNNTKAKVKLGETIRIVTAQVKGATDANSFGDYEAFIEVIVTPKINSDGMIVMDIEIKFDSFIGTQGDQKAIRKINTSVILSNNEILALGGLLRDEDADTFNKTPVLGNVPILGWFFKNKAKTKTKQDLLALVTASIVKAEEKVTDFTKRHLKDYKDTLDEFDVVRNKRDPIDRAFFKDPESEFDLDKFIFTRGKKNLLATVAREKSKVKDSKKRRRRKQKKETKKTSEPLNQTMQVGSKAKKSRRERRKKRREQQTVVSNEKSAVVV